MTFAECLIKCIDNKELVSEFNRLSGHSIGKRRTTLENIIDNACGYDQDIIAFEDFIGFVYVYIWEPLQAKQVQEEANEKV